jgi:hypothetical protein
VYVSRPGVHLKHTLQIPDDVWQAVDEYRYDLDPKYRGSAKQDEEQRVDSTEQKIFGDVPMFAFRCKVMGMSSKVKVVQAPLPTLFMDSGAVLEALVSEDYVKSLGVPLHPASSEQLVLADGTPAGVAGTCTLRVVIGNFKTKVHALVAKLDAAYSLILGERWLVKHEAILDYGREQSRLRSMAKSLHSLFLQGKPRGPVANRVSVQKNLRPASRSAQWPR